ncbi:hypothetical protein G7Z17_g5456 [Cylindrodendrum hubeiense]|uniref:Uncharacterized protein n=1 Tax=Cylindrodendrum hubeiense TaxID=595255 RepID=A0A9P5HEV4_9HYPO|nr:hypothetical protein G7Z17_g5456 [Cylindrodendrum hubeiense]
MIRTAASRRPQVAIPSLGGGAHQERSKIFVRQPTESDDAYYTVNRWGKSPKKPQGSELFQISDLLLDLDDVDSKHVRPFTQDDAAQLKKTWAVDVTRKRFETRLGEADEQMYRSRSKAFEISSNPVNAWRLTSHDILSVALRGAPATPLIGSGEAQRGNADALTACEALDQRQRLGILHTVCCENGISDHALENDELLLQWLKSRQRLLQLGHQWSHVPPTPLQFCTALKEQNTIAGVRRLVSQCLSSGLKATLFQTPPKIGNEKPGKAYADLETDVRKACVNILDRCQPEYPGCVETLAFLGNLRQRMSLDGAHIRGPLCGLGLRLSASIANSEATLEYLGFGFKHNIWTKRAQLMMEDVVFALETYSHHLTTPSEAPPLDISGRETLLQALTGIGEQDEVSPESFRSLVLLFLEKSTGEEAGRAQRAYIAILGKLGAVATLWKEWRLMGGGFERSTQTGQYLPREDGIKVAEDIVAAAEAALSVVALGSEAVPAHLGLAGCAMLDLRSIEVQNPDAWLGNEEDARPMEGFRDGDTRAALDLPLDGWLDAVQRTAGSKSWSPK